MLHAGCFNIHVSIKWENIAPVIVSCACLPIASLIRKFYTFMPCTPKKETRIEHAGATAIYRENENKWDLTRSSWRRVKPLTKTMLASPGDSSIYIILIVQCAFTYFYIINLNVSEWIFIFITLSKLIENNSQVEEDASPFWWCRLERWLILKAAFRTNRMLFSSIFQHFKRLFTSN